MIKRLSNLKLSTFELINTRNRGIRVKVAGYILKAAHKFPSNNSATDLCNPQPGQSTPSNSLFRQGSMYSFRLSCKMVSNGYIIANRVKKNTIIFAFRANFFSIFLRWDV